MSFTPPLYLPGGKALVNNGKFVKGAESCCCTGSSFTVKAIVDWLDDMYIQGDKLWFVNTGYIWQRISYLEINGVSVTPPYDGNLLTLPVTLPNAPVTVVVSEISIVHNAPPYDPVASSSVTEYQQPLEENSYVAILTLDDFEHGGTSIFEFKVSW